jgi:short-subunit dehydrogenase
MRYSGSTAVVTGAASGIGRALAVELATRGAHLAVSDIDKEGLDETVEACRAKGVTAHGYPLDVADRQAVLAHAEQVASDFGSVHLVVNNAGVSVTATVEEITWDDFEWIVGINFWGVVHGTKAFLPHLIASGDGHLVNISSVFGFIGVPSQSSYNATKFAVRGFTEALRQEMLAQRRPVAVSCVHPGGIRTNIVRHSRVPPQEKAELARNFDRMARTSPEKAALTILRGVDRRRARILIGPDAYLIDGLARLTGAGYQRFVARGARRAAPGLTGS